GCSDQSVPGPPDKARGSERKWRRPALVFVTMISALPSWSMSPQDAAAQAWTGVPLLIGSPSESNAKGAKGAGTIAIVLRCAASLISANWVCGGSWAIQPLRLFPVSATLIGNVPVTPG